MVVQMIKPIPDKYTKDQIPLVTAARLDKWLVRLQVWGEKVFMDCLAPASTKFITIECERTQKGLDDAIDAMTEKHHGFDKAKLFDQDSFGEFTDALFARQDLLRKESD